MRTALFFIALSVVGCGSDDSSPAAGSGGSAGSSGDPYYDAVPALRRVADVSACPTGFEAPPAAGQSSGFEAAGQMRSFYLGLPSQAGPRPTLVLFNGTGESGLTIFNRVHAQDFVDAGFIVVAPDSAGNGTLWPVWDGLREPGHENDPNADLDYFDKLLDCISVHFEVDEKRIYVAGHSAGGIFTNAVLRRRSELLAGGIPASSVFDLTGPSPAAELSDMAVVVTWGGDNDIYSGSAGGGVSVPEFNFVEQAAIASESYENEPKVEQAWCKGASLGHAWLPANAWFIDFLLGHPKGLATTSPWQAASTEGSGFSCGFDAAPKPTGTTVTCPSASTTAACQSYCQFLGDCAVENATIEPVLAPQLDALGFAGSDHTQCGGCVTQCEADAQSSADSTVLGCFETAFGSAQCGAGISGAQPLIDPSNSCCKDQTSSGVCTRLCQAINTNAPAAALFSSCAAFK